MADERTPPSLLVRVRDVSDQAAWAEFEGRYRDLVQRYCLRRGLQPADCDDVQQLVWLHLAKGMRNFAYDPARGRFRGYLARVVQNAISRHFSCPDSGNRALDSALLVVVENGQEDADARWEQEWQDHHYRIAMQTIQQTHDRRSVQIFGRLVAGVTVADVAAAFTTTEAVVHKVKQRIRNRMQELIARQIHEEDEPDSVIATPNAQADEDPRARSGG